jgi:hypothetical protein
MNPPESQVTCELPHALGVYRMDPSEFQVTRDTPRALGVYRMDSFLF